MNTCYEKLPREDDRDRENERQRDIEGERHTSSKLCACSLMRSGHRVFSLRYADAISMIHKYVYIWTYVPAGKAIDTNTERQRQRQRDKEKDRETDTQRQGDRQRIH